MIRRSEIAALQRKALRHPLRRLGVEVPADQVILRDGMNIVMDVRPYDSDSSWAWAASVSFVKAGSVEAWAPDQIALARQALKDLTSGVGSHMVAIVNDPVVAREHGLSPYDISGTKGMHWWKSLTLAEAAAADGAQSGT